MSPHTTIAVLRQEHRGSHSPPSSITRLGIHSLCMPWLSFDIWLMSPRCIIVYQPLLVSVISWLHPAQKENWLVPALFLSRDSTKTKGSERLLWPIILADAHTLCFEQCITMSIFEFTDKNFSIWLKSRIQTNFLSSIHWNLWVIFQDQGDFRNEPSSSGSSSAVYFLA